MPRAITMNRRCTGPLALVSVTVLALSGLLLAGPTVADEEIPDNVASGQGTNLASSPEVPDVAPVEEFEELQQAGIDVIGIGVNDAGNTVIVTSSAIGDTPRAQAALAGMPGDVIIMNVGGMPQAASDVEIPAGAGYFHRFGGGGVAEICSTGFAAWAPDGSPAILTAGHCAHDGQASADQWLTYPSLQPAAGKDTGAQKIFGKVAFGQQGPWQLGGPQGLSLAEDPSQKLANGAPNTAHTEVAYGTDIAAITDIAPGFVPVPAMTRWNVAQAQKDDLTSSVIPVKSVGGTVSEGSTITKSGRTTGMTMGTVTSFTDGWFIVQVEWGTYYVHGFIANIVMRPGDSGGPVMQDNRAVGINSGYTKKSSVPGTEDLGFFAYLDPALEQLPAGYEVALDIDQPTLSPGPGRVEAGDAVTVSVPSNATGLMVDGVPVSVTNGNATLTAPSSGVFTRTMVATNGKSASEPLTVTYRVGEESEDPCLVAGTCTVFLNNAWSGIADISFKAPGAGTQILSGDWDGDGKDTIAFRTGSRYDFLATNETGSAVKTLYYGKPGDEVLVGDWNGDGIDTLAVRRGSQYFIKNSISAGVADSVVVYGRPADQVLVGDWNGDGSDTFAVRRGAQYFLKNSMTPGPADDVVVYGRATDTVLVGDWDGDGKDTLAVRRASSYFIKNSIDAGQADNTLAYGRAADVVVIGDWNADKSDTLGVYRAR